MSFFSHSQNPESRQSFNELYEKDNLSSLYQLCVEHLILFMYKISKIITKNIEVQRPKNRLTNIGKVQNSP